MIEPLYNIAKAVDDSEEDIFFRLSFTLTEAFTLIYIRW
jgi:hypothetical protein